MKYIFALLTQDVSIEPRLQEQQCLQHCLPNCFIDTKSIFRRFLFFSFFILTALSQSRKREILSNITTTSYHKT